jgi:hypothetical protein
MLPEAARSEYIDSVSQLMPGWEDGKAETDPTAAAAAAPKQAFGPVSSRLHADDEPALEDTAKTIFDWIHEGNVQAVARLLAGNAEAVLSARDSEVNPKHAPAKLHPPCRGVWWLRGVVG